jgi:hypothetical protein
MTSRTHLTARVRPRRARLLSRLLCAVAVAGLSGGGVLPGGRGST